MLSVLTPPTLCFQAIKFSPFHMISSFVAPLSAHTQFPCTRSLSDCLCVRSLALNTIKPEVSVVFVEPPQQLPLPWTCTGVSEEQVVITGPRTTILSDLISMFHLRNVGCVWQVLMLRKVKLSRGWEEWKGQWTSHSGTESLRRYLHYLPVCQRVLTGNNHVSSVHAFYR